MGGHISREKRTIDRGGRADAESFSTDSSGDSNDNVAKKRRRRLWPFPLKSSIENSRKFVIDFDETKTDNEIDRIQVQHHIYRIIWQGNFKSSVEDLLKEGCNVLDIGCGPGTWVAEMSVDYTTSHITGIDKIKIFPDQKPYNAQFVIGDVLERLPFPSNHFDFIHMRGFIFWFTDDDWKKIIEEATRVLKPGGYLEIFECELTPKYAGPVTEKLTNALVSLSMARRLDPRVERIKDRLIEANKFSHIQCYKKPIPSGNWGNKIGQICVTITTDHCMMQKSKLAPFLRVKESQFKEEIIDGYRREATIYKTFYNSYRFCTRKKISSNEELVIDDKEMTI